MDAVDSMADGLRKVFLAGVGAMATVGEKGGQALDDLAERGESVVKQGKDLNRELTQKGAQATSGIREDLLRARLAGMTSEQRANFVALAQKLSAELDAQEAKAAAKASAVEAQQAAQAEAQAQPVETQAAVVVEKTERAGA